MLPDHEIYDQSADTCQWEKKIQKLRFCLQAYLMKTTQLKQRNELTTHLKHNNYQTGINNLEKVETEQL